MKKLMYIVFLLLITSIGIESLHAQFIPDRFTNRRMNLMNDATSIGWNPAVLGINGKTDAVLVIPYDRNLESTGMIGGFVSHQGFGLGFTTGKSADANSPKIPYSVYGGLGLRIPNENVWIGSSFRYSEFGGRTVRYTGSVIYSPLQKLYMSLGVTNMYSVNTRDHVFEISSAYSPLDWLTLHGRLQYCPDSAIFLRNHKYGTEIGLSAAIHNKQIIASFVASPEAKQARFGVEVNFNVVSIGLLNEASTLNTPAGRFDGGNLLLRINHDKHYSIDHYRPFEPACKTVECSKVGCWGERCEKAICPAFRCVKPNCPGTACNRNNCNGLNCENAKPECNHPEHPVISFPEHGKHGEHIIDGTKGCPLCGCAIPAHSEMHPPMNHPPIRIEKRIKIIKSVREGHGATSGNDARVEPENQTQQVEPNSDAPASEPIETDEEPVKDKAPAPAKDVKEPAKEKTPAPDSDDTIDNGNGSEDIPEEGDDDNPFPETGDELSSKSESGNSGKTFKLRRVFFETAKWNLKSESAEELNKLYKYLTDNPQVCIQLNAHTDNIGSNDYNIELSQKRAQEVVNYLIDKGISPNRIVAKGFGEEFPVAGNDTESGREENRRVEFTQIQCM